LEEAVDLSSDRLLMNEYLIKGTLFGKKVTEHKNVFCEIVDFRCRLHKLFGLLGCYPA
jgi:hypothetical protein